MPFYDYYCPANGETVEVKHGMQERLKTWGEVCEKVGIPLGKISAKEKVQKMITPPELSTVKNDSPSRLRELGFTKLVKRDKGVYENVTAPKKKKYS